MIHIVLTLLAIGLLYWVFQATILVFKLALWILQIPIRWSAAFQEYRTRRAFIAAARRRAR